jgi:hypothetical protein
MEEGRLGGSAKTHAALGEMLTSLDLHRVEGRPYHWNTTCAYLSRIPRPSSD